jgi:hypothetical protein
MGELCPGVLAGERPFNLAPIRVFNFFLTSAKHLAKANALTLQPESQMQMREQKSLEIAREHPAVALPGRSMAHWPYCLASALDAAAPSAYSLWTWFSEDLPHAPDHATSTSKTARSTLGQSRFTNTNKAIQASNI